MIKVKHLETSNWVSALRGMRNAHSSNHKSDSIVLPSGVFEIGTEDMRLARKLGKLGGAHRKFLRQIRVSCDVTANLKWFDQLSTYEFLTSNSTSQMHTLVKEPFTIEMFSNETTTRDGYVLMQTILETLNTMRQDYIDCPRKLGKRGIWRDIVEVMPQSFLYTRTLEFNYEVIYAMLQWRTVHKLSEWEEFCGILKELPYVKEFRGE